MSDEIITPVAPAAAAPAVVPVAAAAPAAVAPAAVPAIPVVVPPVAPPAPVAAPLSELDLLIAASEGQTDAEVSFTEQYITNVATNVALLQFPRDPFGFTSAFKKEFLKAASTIRGQDDKHEIILNTLAILTAHVKARKSGDLVSRAAIHAQRDAITAEAQKRERYQASTTDTLPE